jgi:hypothetical protein
MDIDYLGNIQHRDDIIVIATYVENLPLILFCEKRG